jgi:hypothetical protein
MAGGAGIVRGQNGDPCYIRPNGETITDAKQMRIDCLAFDEHLEAVFGESGRQIKAAISYGDLCYNEEYLAWVRTAPDGSAKFLCRRSEEARIARGHVYHALGVEADGGPWAGRVRFQLGVRETVVSETGEDLSRRLLFIVTGPPVTWDGRSFLPTETTSAWKADLRHLLTLPPARLSTGGGGGNVLLGEADLMADPERLRAAVEGAPVWVALPACDQASLASDAATRGYTLRQDPSAVTERGDLFLGCDCACIRYLPGVYPHGVLGISATQDAWIALQVHGVSTRSGCTVAELGQLMEAAGARNAVALDQGADPQRVVQLKNEGDLLYKPSFNYRARVAAALVWVG